MPSIEDKLKQYRDSKAEEIQKDKLIISTTDKDKPSKLKSSINFLSTILKYSIAPFKLVNDYIHSSRLYIYLDNNSPKCLIAIKISLWLILWWLAVLAEFGIIFLIISAIAFMFLNTSTRAKLDGEPSAYSVFNENCERIKGTLTAEQLEKNLVYGSMF